MENKRFLLILGGIGVLLLIPAVPMQFSNEGNWKPFDFKTMGFLLLGTGLLCVVVLRAVKSLIARLIPCGGILLVLLVIWAELAVGILG
ncbi:hypothetical protein MATR_14250 [Marivirga tractuosa]|uniref:Uncharacterized protein n=1 Tax=Marivirga tractuosa (strain ATCC 23168 / DSM 4126 / NBRC 15989 / NCIMB 1408 / VKM B-1430 / H-43) TaxID=643867 RepID=E4TTN2_MARTH|nr:hypothetical protein [Marivirga tractuosa]ADR20949.1 hypothetical protein Ftrac_0947 [Marivirga tractuosa DSM 4126]BDD14600.1 hypothetical protein MATR_14250 [Marivirga tractuosa]